MAKKKAAKKPKKTVTMKELDDRLRAVEFTLRGVDCRSKLASTEIFKHVDAHTAVGWPKTGDFPQYSTTGLASHGGREYRKIISETDRDVGGPICDVVIIIDPADRKDARIERRRLVPSRAYATDPCTAEAFEAALARMLDVLRE